MGQDASDKVTIVELTRDDPSLPTLNSRYLTTSYYDLSVCREPSGWTVELTLKPFEAPVAKSYTGTLFEQHVTEPRVFAAVLDGDQVGWVELGYETWNNRMRMWEFLVKEEFRRLGIGRRLMARVIQVAKARGARMVVLETQSCNVPAVAFYLQQGFRLIGFDRAAYSNEDVEKREVRLEMGLTL